MEIWLYSTVFIRATLEDQSSRFHRLSLRCLWHLIIKQVRIYHYPQCTSGSKKKFKELVASLFDGMMQEVGLDD